MATIANRRQGGGGCGDGVRKRWNDERGIIKRENERREEKKEEIMDERERGEKKEKVEGGERRKKTRSKYVENEIKLK